MTVAELIAKLSAIEDQSRNVVVEGCDCINDAKGIDTDDPDVMIQADL